MVNLVQCNVNSCSQNPSLVSGFLTACCDVWDCSFKATVYLSLNTILITINLYTGILPLINVKQQLKHVSSAHVKSTFFTEHEVLPISISSLVTNSPPSGQLRLKKCTHYLFQTVPLGHSNFLLQENVQSVQGWQTPIIIILWLSRIFFKCYTKFGKFHWIWKISLLCDYRMGWLQNGLVGLLQ